jgi:hypothetical protein
MGFQHQLSGQGPSFAGDTNHDPGTSSAARSDTGDAPVVSLTDSLGVQAYPSIEGFDSSSFTGNPVSCPVALSSPLAGHGYTRTTTGLVLSGTGEVGLRAPPELAPQSSARAGLIGDIAGSDTSPYIKTLLQSPDSAILQNFYAPIENTPQAAENLSDEELRPGKGPQLRRKIDKKPHQPRKSFPQNSQGIMHSKITKNVSGKPSKTRALSKVRRLYRLMPSLATKLSQPALPKLILDEMGNLQGVMQIFGAKQRVRSALTEEEKASTAVIRQIHACIRCKILKKKVGVPYK